VSRQLAVASPLSVLLLLSIATLAQQAPPVGDTFVNAAASKTNYGGNLVLAVGPGSPLI
jgi:hypothetical protein